MIPGHGAQGTLAAIRGNRAYLADMINQVRAGIARGATAEQLAKEIKLTQSQPVGPGSRPANQGSIRAVYAKLKAR